MTTFPELPSARELGISSAHRRNLLRESYLRVELKCMRDSMTDAASTRASEDIGGIRLEIAGGEPEADKLRQSFSATAHRFHARAVDYLQRRAAGEQARAIVQSYYPQS